MAPRTGCYINSLADEMASRHAPGRAISFTPVAVLHLVIVQTQPVYAVSAVG